MGSSSGGPLDFSLPPDLQRLRIQASEVARAAGARRSFPEDSWMVGYDRAFTRDLAERGWIGMTWPRRYGGQGRSSLERFVVYEQLIMHGAPIAAGWFADRQIGPALLRFGTPEQQHRWLPEIVSGRAMWCIGMSEPDAGSDVSNVRTSAEWNGNGWSVTGGKVWTSGAFNSDWCYCVVRTERSADRHGGLSDLVIDMRSPGVTARPIRDMTQNEHFCEVTFDDVQVPADCLIGEQGNSFRQIMRQMEHERGGIDRWVSNYALYRDLLDQGLARSDDPLARQEIARIESLYRIGRLMVLREALGMAPSGYSALTKTLGTEFETTVANFATQQLGPSSLLWGARYGIGGRASRAVCYAPGYTIMGGTTQILRNILAERVLKLPRDPLP